MSLTVKDNGKTFLPAPEGLQIARCYAVIDLGVQLNGYFNNYSPKVLIGWELPKALMPDGKPYIQYQRYTASLTEGSHLRKLLESWRRRSFTAEELEGFHSIPENIRQKINLNRGNESADSPADVTAVSVATEDLPF